MVKTMKEYNEDILLLEKDLEYDKANKLKDEVFQRLVESKDEVIYIELSRAIKKEFKKVLLKPNTVNVLKYRTYFELDTFLKKLIDVRVFVEADEHTLGIVRDLYITEIESKKDRLRIFVKLDVDFKDTEDNNKKLAKEVLSGKLKLEDVLVSFNDNDETYLFFKNYYDYKIDNSVFTDRLRVKSLMKLIEYFGDDELQKTIQLVVGRDKHIDDEFIQHLIKESKTTQFVIDALEYVDVKLMMLNESFEEKKSLLYSKYANESKKEHVRNLMKDINYYKTAREELNNMLKGYDD